MSPDAPHDLRAALADLALLRFPQLVDPGTATGREVDDMDEPSDRDGSGDKVQTAFRLDRGLLDRVDRYAARIQRRTGAQVSRTNAAQALMTLGIDCIDLVDADPLLTGEPSTVRDLITLALAGLEEARRRSGDGS